jgi:hypothetical protein
MPETKQGREQMREMGTVTANISYVRTHFESTVHSIVEQKTVYAQTIFEKIKHQIQVRHPSQYAGQDMVKLVEDFSIEARLLTMAGYYDHTLTHMVKGKPAAW